MQRYINLSRIWFCVSGHYCTLGSEEIAPVNKTFGDYCPAGNYCPEGTSTPVPCPSGTFLNETGMGMEDDCIHCSPGYYCETTGKTVVTNMCDAGYYCTLRANISSPTDGTTGMFMTKKNIFLKLKLMP